MKTLGQIGFEAAGEAAPDSWPYVGFDELQDYGKTYWEAAAKAVALEVLERAAKAAHKRIYNIGHDQIADVVAQDIRALKDAL